MIVEQRTYTLRPLRTQDFLALYERAALPLQKKYQGHLVGFFVSEHPGWPAYVNALRELDVVLQQETKMLRSVSFSPV